MEYAPQILFPFRDTQEGCTSKIPLGLEGTMQPISDHQGVGRRALSHSYT